MNISLRNMLLSYIETRICNTSGKSNKWLHFFARHKTIHKLFNKVIKSKLCEWIITCICREAVKKYGHVSFEKIFHWLKKYPHFSEDTKINSKNDLYERFLNKKRLQWLSGILSEFDLERKTKLLKRIFYNIILNSLNRKSITLRFQGNQHFVPNLRTVLLSTSSKCNLDCVGCESANDRNDNGITFEHLDYIIRQAKRLNVFHVVIIGKGEPLYDNSSKRTLIRLVRTHRDINFILFTNGTTLEECDLVEIKKLDNLFTIVSIDGLEDINDKRKGHGVYKNIMAIFELMKQYKLLYGFSSMVYKENYHHILSGEFLHTMMEMGCKIGIYLKFIPLGENSNGKMMLNDREVYEFNELFNAVKEDIAIPIIDPEIFEQEKGCRAKKGSIIYIDGTTGKVMPCVKTPFAPEECNIYLNPHKDNLLKILKTDFFTNFRHSYNTGEQCSKNLSEELKRYCENSDVSQRDKERVRQFLNNIQEIQ